MSVLEVMQPRDRAVAAHVISTLAGVAGGVSVLFAALTPGEHGTTPLSLTITIATCLCVVAAAILLRRMESVGTWVWATVPFASIIAITALDLVTRDASVSAQIFFFFPALYAAFQLRRYGAIAVAAAAIAGDLIDVFVVLPPRDAFSQSAYLTAAIVTSTALLVLSGERQDALVAQLQHQAAIDSLTGLFTRRVLDNAAAVALSGGASKLGTGLILIDIDNFKQINDEYGHPAGDEVLVRLARVLLLGVRPSDTVSRMGGDEVAVLLAGCSLDAVQRRAEEILWEVRAHAFEISADVTLSVSVSIGVAHLPTHGHDLRALYSAADASLYTAKRGGRNQIGPVPDPQTHLRAS
jgi:diguanylate cyclase (GGDEF)-like protein